jgi:hypothetical protein
MKEAPKGTQVWTHAEASRTIQYVRLLLRNLRENFVLMWHVYRLVKSDAANQTHRQMLQTCREEAHAAFDELNRLSVIAYESPLRGIALFPFLVPHDCDTLRRAYFVYKDSRDTIDSFVFEDDLCESRNLYACEQQVPNDWKAPVVIPTSSSSWWST